MARTVVIQRGHVPRTSGKTGTGGLDNDPTEQKFNIAAADACARRLEQVPGIEVRVIDADEATGRYKGHVFIAVHCDGSVNPDAHGASIGWQSPEGKAFGDLWRRAYKAQGWTGGFRADNYTKALAGYYGVKHAIKQGNRVAICCECGFLTHAGNEGLLTPPGGADRFAAAVEDAVRGYFGIPRTFGQPDNEEDDVPGPRYLIVRGRERNDCWVTDFAVAYPLGGAPNASQQAKDAQQSLLVITGAAGTGDDGRPIELDQSQLDSIPKIVPSG